MTFEFDDTLLRFAGINIWGLSSQGRLLSVHPGGTESLGWREDNRETFSLERDFLNCNNLSMTDFPGLPEKHSQEPCLLRWAGPDGRISAPLPTLWRRPASQAAHFQVIFRIPQSPSNRNLVLERLLYHQARHLPGLIHNLNGPLGTLMGELELLQLKHPEFTGGKNLEATGRRLMNLLRMANLKITQELYETPQAIDMNHLVQTEIAFWQNDLHFKHHVNIHMDLETDLPPLDTQYASFSGILNEGCYFLKQFFHKENDYGLHVYTQLQNAELTVGLTARGKLSGNRASFPLKINIHADRDLPAAHPGLDTAFLRACSAVHGGQISISGSGDELDFRYQCNIRDCISADSAE